MLFGDFPIIQLYSEARFGDPIAWKERITPRHAERDKIIRALFVVPGIVVSEQGGVFRSESKLFNARAAWYDTSY